MAKPNRVQARSRKSIRQAIAALLESHITDFVAVYDHETADFERKSPVAMVHSDGTAALTAPRMEAHAFIISLWWARADADLTEDYIDDLSEDVRALLKNNHRTIGDWSSLTIDDGFSEMDYPIVDGVMYRYERIRVIVW